MAYSFIAVGLDGQEKKFEKVRQLTVLFALKTKIYKIFYMDNKTEFIKNVDVTSLDPDIVTQVEYQRPYAPLPVLFS